MKAVSGMDHIHLVGSLSRFDEIASALLATGCPQVVFDVLSWYSQRAEAALVARRVARAMASGLHAFIHPGDEPACRPVLKQAVRDCRASKLFFDGCGTPLRSDAELNAKLYAEVVEALDGLVGITVLASANPTQVHAGDPELLGEVGNLDWFGEVQPGFEMTRFPDDVYKQIDGGVVAAMTDENLFPEAKPMLAWVRIAKMKALVGLPSQPPTLYAAMAAVIAAAERYGFGIGWQITSADLLALTLAELALLQSRAEARSAAPIPAAQVPVVAQEVSR